MQIIYQVSADLSCLLHTIRENKAYGIYCMYILYIIVIDLERNRVVNKVSDMRKATI